MYHNHTYASSHIKNTFFRKKSKQSQHDIHNGGILGILGTIWQKNCRKS